MGIRFCRSSLAYTACCPANPGATLQELDGWATWQRRWWRNVFLVCLLGHWSVPRDYRRRRLCHRQPIVHLRDDPTCRWPYPPDKYTGSFRWESLCAKPENEWKRNNAFVASVE